MKLSEDLSLDAEYLAGEVVIITSRPFVPF